MQEEQARDADDVDRVADGVGDDAVGGSDDDVAEDVEEDEAEICAVPTKAVGALGDGRLRHRLEDGRDGADGRLERVLLERGGRGKVEVDTGRVLVCADQP